MKKVLITAFIIPVMSLFITGNAAAQTYKETREEKDFRAVSFGISGNLVIKLGSQFSVVLEGDRKLIDETETFVRDGRLIIRRTNNFSFRNGNISCYVTMPDLEGLSVSGSGNARIEGNIKADNLDFSVSGSGTLQASGITADSFECSISGSGDIIIEDSGSADRGEIGISGSGSYKGESFEIDDLSVSISGSGSCTCKAGDILKARVSGSGNVWYYGQPKVDARTSGSGHVRSR